MFNIDASEFLLVAFVALIVIGPKDLPKAMRVVGYWVGKARGVARQFRSGFDSMVREAELEEMEKRWASENERIMREHPQSATDGTTDTAQVVHSPETEEHRRDYRSVDDTSADHTSVDHTGADHTGEPVMVEKPVVAPAEPVSGKGNGHVARSAVVADTPGRDPDLFDTQSPTTAATAKSSDDTSGKPDVAPS